MAESATSSEESDQKVCKEDQTTAPKRSYECTFCKRGFTNAQALGGHMNIHRKDRAKAKQQIGTTTTTTTLFSSKLPMVVNEEYMNPRYHAYSASEVQMNNYLMYYQSSMSSNPNLELFLPRSSCMKSPSGNDHQEVNLGANLSLGIGTNEVMKTGIVKEDEHEILDLELRLGHNP